MEATGIAVTDKETKSTLMNPLVFILFIMVIFLTAHTVYQVKRKGKTVKQALKDDAKLLATPTAVIAILGFVTGLIEFIITDNVNTHGFPDSFTKGKIFTLPDKKTMISTAVTLAIASTITGLLTDLALKQLPKQTESGYNFMG
jgi:heme/copper-type cytochrome/quinol oxidase subunit 2